MKTSKLTGADLNLAVAKIIGLEIEVMYGVVHDVHGEPFMPDLDWNVAGPIIERELIEICPIGTGEWRGQLDVAGDLIRFYGDTPLIAAMRCFVASKMGDEVEIPEEED